jgi:peptidoglycan hydrolase CwlO-like protein
MKGKLAVVVTLLILIVAVLGLTIDIQAVSDSFTDKLLDHLEGQSGILKTFNTSQQVMSIGIQAMGRQLKALDTTATTISETNQQLLIMTKGLKKDIESNNSNVLKLTSQIQRLNKEIETLKTTITKSKQEVVDKKLQ